MYNNICLENILYFLKGKQLLKNYWLGGKFKSFKLKNFMINSRVALYNGRFFIPIKISKYMVGDMVNFFFFTKSILIKSMEKRRKKKKRKK